MIEVNGKYASAKIFAEICEPSAMAQIIELLNQPFIEGSKVRIMPDVHAGAGCVIGTTIDIARDGIVPNLVGVDIGCGVIVQKICQKKNEIDFVALDRFVRDNIPSGFSVREEALKKDALFKLVDTIHAQITPEQRCRAEKSIGTLGGGNHFIEIAESTNDDSCYVCIHSGSRNIGKLVADHHQRLAISKQVSGPKHLAALYGIDAANYKYDMHVMQMFASENRRQMINRFCQKDSPITIDLHGMSFTTIHNYISGMMLRKGSVEAEFGHYFIVPMNMRDGSLVCVGKGNEDWNNSAPHGAGRIMGRGQAKRTLSLDDYKKQMAGIFTTCVSQHTIDESPGVYKNMDEIASAIEETATIVDRIVPIYNFKAGEEQ